MEIEANQQVDLSKATHSNKFTQDPKKSTDRHDTDCKIKETAQQVVSATRGVVSMTETRSNKIAIVYTEIRNNKKR
ncbi:hypothetical protein HUJ05_013272 [Dendroctonus ponderosae]|nr:hypothetical protein HUJ05_013272 [Dendroctonus ponderosae]